MQVLPRCQKQLQIVFIVLQLFEEKPLATDMQMMLAANNTYVNFFLKKLMEICDCLEMV